MDLLENAASAISARNTRSHHSKSHRGYRSDREYRKHREHRDRDRKSRSRSRSRHSRHSKTAGSAVGAGSVVGGGGLTGLAASFFGGGGGDDVDGFDYGEDYSNYKPPHKSSKHRDRGRGIDDDDDTRSFFSGIGGGRDGKDRGFFGLTGGDTSRSGFFSGFGGRSGTPASSYYKRSPRPNFVSRMMKKLKRLLRDLVYYAKRHPLKVFMVVIMPLVTGGFLTALLAKVGIRLPKFVERMLGMAAKASTGDSIGVVGDAMKMVSGGGSKRGGGGLGGAAVNYAKSTFEKGSNGGMQWERRSVEKDYFGGNAGSAALKGVAKMFS